GGGVGRGRRLAGIAGEPPPPGEVRGEADVDPAVVEGQADPAGDPPLGDDEDEEDAQAGGDDKGVVPIESGAERAPGGERGRGSEPATRRAVLHGAFRRRSGA